MRVVISFDFFCWAVRAGWGGERTKASSFRSPVSSSNHHLGWSRIHWIESWSHLGLDKSKIIPMFVQTNINIYIHLFLVKHNAIWCVALLWNPRNWELTREKSVGGESRHMLCYEGRSCGWCQSSLQLTSPLHQWLAIVEEDDFVHIDI